MLRWYKNPGVFNSLQHNSLSFPRVQIPGDIFNCQHVTCDSVFGALSVSCSGFLPHRPRQSSPLPLLHSLSTSKLLSTPFLPPQLVHLSTIFVSENTFRL
uniref:Uncharacterized protein n=1 Tax=Cacopsylla melanoneura TaxID=428564 RepID=A0A8D9B9V2_9HEMI